MNKFSVTLIAGLLLVAIVLCNGHGVAPDEKQEVEAVKNEDEQPPFQPEPRDHGFNFAPMSEKFQHDPSRAAYSVGVGLDELYAMNLPQQGVPLAVKRRENKCSHETGKKQCNDCCKKLVGPFWVGRLVNGFPSTAKNHFLKIIKFPVRKCKCQDSSLDYEQRTYAKENQDDEDVDEHTGEQTDGQTVQQP